MNSLWLRLYIGILNDPKIQKLPAEVFKNWINILCIAKLHDGVLPDVSEISFILRCDEDTAQKAVDQLLKHNLLDKKRNIIEPHEWKKYQFISDVSTQRVKRFRERSKDNNETFQKGSETVSETSPEQSRAETDSRAETEQKDLPFHSNKKPKNANLVGFDLEKNSDMIPDKLKSLPGFREAYSMFLEMRATAKKNPVKILGAKRQFKQCLQLLESGKDLIDAIEHSTDKQYDGIFPAPAQQQSQIRSKVAL